MNKIVSGCDERYEGNQRPKQTQHGALLGLRGQRAPRRRPPTPRQGARAQRTCQGRELQV